jgi:chaperonin GroES
MEIGDFTEVFPLEDRVVIRPNKKEEITTSGIIIPDAGTEGPVRGVVLGIGPGKYDERGNLLPMNVAVGDEVLYGTKYYGTEVDFDGESVLIIPQSNILAIIKRGK